MITFTCQHCTRGLRVDPALSLKRVRCPACKQVITVPRDELPTASWSKDITLKFQAESAESIFSEEGADDEDALQVVSTPLPERSQAEKVTPLVPPPFTAPIPGSTAVPPSPPQPPSLVKNENPEVLANPWASLDASAHDVAPTSVTNKPAPEESQAAAGINIYHLLILALAVYSFLMTVAAVWGWSR